MDVRRLLNEREDFLVEQLDESFRKKFRRDPSRSSQLVYFLGDRFEFGKTWSASSGRLPCFRKNSGIYLHRRSMLIYTGQDKLAALGWPTTSETAAALGCKCLPSVEPGRSDFLAGNAMHLTNISLVILVTLASFSLK